MARDGSEIARAADLFETLSDSSRNPTLFKEIQVLDRKFSKVVEVAGFRAPARSLVRGAAGAARGVKNTNFLGFVVDSCSPVENILLRVGSDSFPDAKCSNISRFATLKLGRSPTFWAQPPGIRPGPEPEPARKSQDPDQSDANSYWDTGRIRCTFGVPRSKIL